MRERLTHRRAFLVLASTVVGMAALSSTAGAQVAAKRARIGFLAPVAHPEREIVFREALAKLGYVEGRNLDIEYRSAEGSSRDCPLLLRNWFASTSTLLSPS